MNRELLKENIIHGNAMFPLKLYDLEMDGKRVRLDCHWHDELEFFMVTKGKAIIQIETTCYELSAGQAVFINKGDIHAGHLLDNSPCSFRAVVFSEQFLCSNIFDLIQCKYLDPLLKKQFIYPVQLTISSPWQNETLSLLSQIADLYITKPNAYELLIKGLLYQSLSILLSNSQLETSTKRAYRTNYKTERLKKVLLYIQSNYNKKITVKELADLINMSEGHFCGFFKELVRKSPIEYLNCYRVTKASEQLENTDEKIIHIALQNGFDSFSYFINTFKRIMNCTPSQYRKNHSLPPGIS